MKEPPTCIGNLFDSLLTTWTLFFPVPRGLAVYPPCAGMCTRCSSWPVIRPNTPAPLISQIEHSSHDTDIGTSVGFSTAPGDHAAIYVSGDSRGGGSDISFLAKFDSNGVQTWIRRFGVPGGTLSVTQVSTLNG